MKHIILPIIYIICIALTLSIVQNKCRSQNFWQGSLGPSYGPTSKLVKCKNGDIYSGSSAGLYKTTDSGFHWKLVLPGTFFYNDITELASDSNNVIYACGDHYEIYTSHDLGSTWWSLNNSMNPGADKIFVFPNNVTLAGSDGTYRSKDGGITWIKLNNIPFNSVDIDSNGTLFATGDHYIRKSSDNGVTWEALEACDYRSPVVKVLSNGNVLVGTKENYWPYILLSNDGGMNWERTNNGALFNSTGLIRSIIQLKNGNVLTALLEPDNQLSSGNLKISSDFGYTWNDLKKNTPYPFTYFDIIELENGNLIAATDVGVYISTNEGKDWLDRNYDLFNSSISSMAFDKNDFYCGTSNAGLFKSVDRGLTWMHIKDFSIYTVSCIGLDKDNNIYVSFCDFRKNDTTGVSVSTDGGNSWSSKNNGLADADIISFLFRNDGKIFALEIQDGVYYSSDAGNTWHQCSYEFTNVYDFNQLAQNSKGDIILSSSGGIYRSTNEGVHWQNITNNLPTIQLEGLAINSDDDIFVSCVGYGIYRSTNNGISWDKKSYGLTNTFFRGITISKNGYLFAYCGNNFDEKGGVFLSTNNGMNWVNISSGLTIWNMRGIAFDDQGYIYAGSVGGGIFKSTQQVTSINQNENSGPSGEYLWQSYPNPFGESSFSNTNTTNISFQINTPTPQHIIIKVFDALGREIKLLGDGIYESGSHHLTFNGKGLNSGQYFIRMNAQNNGVVESKVIKVIYIK